MQNTRDKNITFAPSVINYVTLISKIKIAKVDTAKLWIIRKLLKTTVQPSHVFSGLIHAKTLHTPFGYVTYICISLVRSDKIISHLQQLHIQ